MSYFVYNGKDSREFGILAKCPIPPTAKEIVNTVEILGKPEKMLTHTGRYEDIELPVELQIAENRNAIRDVYAWLDGTGELQLSDNLNDTYIVKNIILAPERVSLRFGKVLATFICEPFAYDTNTITEDLTAYYVGDNTALSLELYYTRGSTLSFVIYPEIGDQNETSIYVNGKWFKVKYHDEIVNSGGDGYQIIVDCTNNICYFIRPDGTKVNCTQCTTGTFPQLKIGGNLVGHNKNIKKMFISLRGRWK